MRLKKKDDTEQEEEEEDLRKLITGTQVIKSSVALKSGENDSDSSSDSKRHLYDKYRVDEEACL